MARQRESYEGLMEKLEKILEVIDGSELTLEESMKKYEEGIKICNKLYKILNGVEGKVKILTEEGEKDLK